jgi:hypothetical protein
MPKFTSEGYFNVRIDFVNRVEYRWDVPEFKNNPRAFTLKMHVVTPDGVEGWHLKDYSKREVKPGKFFDSMLPKLAKAGVRLNADGTMTEEMIVIAQLWELGVEDGYPGTLGKMMNTGTTIEAQACVKGRDFSDNGTIKRIYEVKYLNPLKNETNIIDIDFDALLGDDRPKATAAVTVILQKQPAEVEATPPPDDPQLDDDGEPIPF